MRAEMFHHLTLLRVRDDVSSEVNAAAAQAAQGLAEVIPSIVSMSAGVAVPNDAGWDQAYTFSFESAEGFEAFAHHPAHGEFVERYVHPYADTVMSVDYEDIATAGSAPPEQRRA